MSGRQTGPCEHLHWAWCPECDGGRPVPAELPRMIPAGPGGTLLERYVRELLRRFATGTHTPLDVALAETILAWTADPAAAPPDETMEGPR